MSARTPTPKQILLAHVREAHPRLSHVNEKWTMKQVSTLHAKQHHQLSPNHYHEGVNLGPSQRPPGWYTGEGAVPRKGLAR